jgi:hypothetical protein
MLSDGGAGFILLFIGMIGFAIVEIGAMLAFFGNAALIGFAVSAWIPFYLLKGRPPGHWLGRPLLVMSLMLLFAGIYVGGGFSLLLSAGELISDNPDSVSVALSIVGVGLGVLCGSFVLLGLLRDRARQVLGLGAHSPGKRGRILRVLLQLGLGLGSACIVASVVGVALSVEGTVKLPGHILALAAAGAVGMVIADVRGAAFLQAEQGPQPASRPRWVVGELMLWGGSIGLGVTLILAAAMAAAGVIGVASLTCVGICTIVPVGMLWLSRIGGPLRGVQAGSAALDLHGDDAIAGEE